jgi:hypothetical protein
MPQTNPSTKNGHAAEQPGATKDADMSSEIFESAAENPARETSNDGLTLDQLQLPIDLQPNWRTPIFNIPPTTPVETAAIDGESRGDETSATSRDTPAAETRVLFEQWLEATINDRPDIEEELVARGFVRPPMRLVKQYLSDDLATRLRIVDRVLTEPGVDARPWMMLLAEDEDPDVRLSAITAMATSDDKVLIEKAWQVAIRDRDPRIADLAGRLRERRR